MELVETVRGEPREVSRVRHALAAALADWGVNGEDFEVAVLLTSEIVTNAIRYGGPPMELHAQITGAELLVSMDDGGHEAVVPVENVQWYDKGGRGLHLVEALSNRWGVRDCLRGKQVWFELKLAG
ncbi:ATP-binding protein [Angustibacter sp. McL0619]|uniref:ATP-binding protein n=1 Tax=Angustibacter sp. McL0619 TaxID=3415676 RepID=UPI003CEB8307